MTILTPPTWLENSAVHNAQDYRTMLASLVTGRSGTATDDAFAVTERAGTPNMSVDVAAGGMFVASTRSSSAGTYHVYNDGTVNVPLSAADATNPRIDRVLVQVRDEEQDAALTQNDARILVVEGTPAASPSLPAITVEDYVELAQITVPASATAISDSEVDDQRARAAALGGVTPCTSSTRPSSPQAGEFAYELDTDLLLVWDGAAWVRADWSTAWGKIDGAGGSGTSFAATTPTQAERTGLDVVDGRAYMIHFEQPYSNSAADNAMTVTVEVDEGGGYSTLDTLRYSNAIVSPGGSTDQLGFTTRWEPGATTGSGKVRVRTSRYTGAGTFNMGTWQITIVDVGPA